jgi:glycosyltransferase involved in cell wall biosynthesis
MLAELRRRTDIDIVHDHLEVVGPSTLAAAGVPTLHTLHWDLGRHAPFYATLDCRDTVWVNGVSADQLGKAPDALRPRVLGHVHLATPLADDAEHRPLPAKADHVVVLGRITHAKGQHIAVRVARELGWPLVLAGPVGPFRDPDELRTGLAERPELRSTNPDVRYFCEQIADHVDGTRVRWAGTLHGAELARVMATARATLTPITWDEPGGTAVVESLALGTPVIGFRRGCLPELVNHGRTGLLATPDDEADLAEQLLKSPYLDPAACVQEAVERFRPAVMAENYLRLYRKVLDSGS